MSVFVNIIGHNASGKSTLAQKLAADLPFNRISGDEFRLFAIEHIAYFNELDLSHPNGRHDLLSPLVLAYRNSMAITLLGAQQNVIMEGSGLLREYRQKYINKIRAEVPETTIVLIKAEISEEEILKRLQARDETTRDRSWEDMFTRKESLLEWPTEDEADKILSYTQDNYEEIRSNLEKLMAPSQKRI